MRWLAGILSLLLIVIDQWVKRWADLHLDHYVSRDLISGFLGLRLVYNEGAAFGLMQGWRWFFVALTVGVIAGIVYYYARLPKEPRFWLIRIPLLLILAGAVGNFIDRFRNGYVIDMFEFQFMRFPIFNVADICLVTGTFLLAFVFLFVIKDFPHNE